MSTCCEGSGRDRFLMKLGRCPKCVRWSVYLSLLGFGGLLASLTLWRQPAFSIAALCLAVPATCLLLAHLVELAKRLRWEEAMRRPAEPVGGPHLSSRRDFLASA